MGNADIRNQVVDFHATLFEVIFTAPFRSRIKNDRLRERAVVRQVEDAADAASQSLARFFINTSLTDKQAANILRGFVPLGELLALSDIANANVTPEEIVARLQGGLPCPKPVAKAGKDAEYRVALHMLVQVLMLVGPVMAEWQKLKFASTYELPRKVVNRLNQISEQMGAIGAGGASAADGNYELTYRDYLLQRFHRVEAGTIRMTTQMDVDLRELFVMPRVLARPMRAGLDGAEGVAALMNLAAARAVFERRTVRDETQSDKTERVGVTALAQVKGHNRTVIVGAPGSGKSTFFEWLQVKVASVEEEWVLGGQQAIPLLLRMRQLDPRKLPSGATMIEKATNSQDRAALMPAGWLERQMQAGRVLFLLDGLDETEPELRDEFVLPWLAQLCEQYPACCFVLSSRPVGYPPGTMSKLGFVECDLLDFDAPEIAEYAQHWCTAVRLAQNELDEEARREGAADGARIVAGFEGNPYINNLARNPLMLSAICLVNYFEGGELPKDRAMLYRLCVEGLLHNWDQRRGIRSEFGLDEKLRVCREVAIAMQADDRAEYETEQVLAIFTAVLNDAERAVKLLEHIRYRTGLLIERRAKVFAFAHLTFQEYLAACAVREGNKRNVTTKQLAKEHNDGRWREVIALYCGSVTPLIGRQMIELLLKAHDTADLSEVIAEVYLSTNKELLSDKPFRQRVLERIAVLPCEGTSVLQRFETDEVIPIANKWIGHILGSNYSSESWWWLDSNPEHVDIDCLLDNIRNRSRKTPMQLAELLVIAYKYFPISILVQPPFDAGLLTLEGIKSQDERYEYASQAEIAAFAFFNREPFTSSDGKHVTLVLQSLYEVLGQMELGDFFHDNVGSSSVFGELSIHTKREVIKMTRGLISLLIKKRKSVRGHKLENLNNTVSVLREFLSSLSATLDTNEVETNPPKRTNPNDP